MSIISWLCYHKHYWGIPHERDADERLVQTCYECGAEREIKVELRPSLIAVEVEPRNNLKAA
jgi:hypothetical protein